jgi:hypothetical protein
MSKMVKLRVVFGDRVCARFNVAPGSMGKRVGLKSNFART